MRDLCLRGAAMVLALVSSWGCAGDGTGLDQFGNPITGTLAALGPTLSGVQDHIFTPLCTQCHTGASAPLGLVLDEGVSHENLVGVESVQMPDLLRVDPGRPESSYIMWKVEGRAGVVGGRMPLGSVPLSNAQLTALRGWIAAGAGKD